VLHIGDGYYRLDLPDAAVASGVDGVMVGGTVTGMVVIGCYVPLVQRAIPRNQAFLTYAFMMTDSTNHAPATGKTVTCTRSIDGGAFGAGTLANVTEVGNGIYIVDFAAADLNGKNVVLRATATGCDDTFRQLFTE
jgi:hypothetical protein